jgi:predicted transcriptional regulator
MNSELPNLSILVDSSISSELDLVSELFHRINRIIPEHQKLISVPPDMSVREAMALMRDHEYSQVPVVARGLVLGVFSFRSFALKAASVELEEAQKQKAMPGDLTVDEFLEKFQFARVTDEMQQVFDAMSRDNGVLIGSPESLQGILTPMDFLEYLYKLASPFVMISEIELALRALIRTAVTEQELATCALRALSQLYGEDKVPQTLERMTFDNYRTVVCDGRNWPKFESVLGCNRARVDTKLKEICEIRNDLFHFRRPITLEDHEMIAEHRDWLLSKANQADARRCEGDKK